MPRKRSIIYSVTHRKVSQYITVTFFIWEIPSQKEIRTINTLTDTVDELSCLRVFSRGGADYSWLFLICSISVFSGVYIVM